MAVIYTLATVIAPDNGLAPAKATRCIGMYTKAEKAVQAIMENHGDLWEAGYYTHAVVEGHKEGLYGNIIGSLRWFEAVYEDGKNEPVEVKEIETPPWAQNIIGWGIG